jgi:hypothetical protein
MSTVTVKTYTAEDLLAMPDRKVIDLLARTIRIHRHDGSVSWHGEDHELSGEDVLPGFRLPLAMVFLKSPVGNDPSGQGPGRTGESVAPR